MMISGLFLLLLNLPGKFKLNKTYRIIVVSIFFLVFIAALLISLGDIYYYQFSKRRISYEIFNLMKSIPELWTIVLKDFLIQLIFASAFILLLGFVWFKLLLRKTKGSHQGIANDIIYFILTIAVIVLSIRGGFQLKPLRESYAFRNDNISLGHLSLNAVFTTIRTLNRGDLRQYNFYPFSESKETVRELLKADNEVYLNNEYTLMRQRTMGHNGQNKMNVVIFVMESWSGGLIDGKNVENSTPNFRELVKKGIHYTNFYASGQRTIQGIQAIVSSIPNVAYDDILGSPIEQNKLRPLGNILKEYDYKTIFIHGARSGSMGFEAFSKLSGFDTYISKDDFDLNEVRDDGTWGIFDHYVFDRANKEFLKTGKPFLGVIMSLSSHTPYTVPAEEFNYYDSTVTNYKFLNSLRYSDWSLGKFFEAAQKEDYFKNTLFVIVSDHAEGTGEKSLIELFRIPCLFYAPSFLKPSVDSTVHSQVDILPTIIDVLNLPVIHSSLGLSMLSEKEGFAYISSGNILGWLKGDWFLIGDQEKNISLYNIHKDIKLTSNLIGSNSSTAALMRRQMLSYLHVSTQLLRSNKIYRE
jgi:phosphoglycerol transferase MdoB-like AlkP superfamily enzyme